MKSVTRAGARLFFGIYGITIFALVLLCTLLLLGIVRRLPDRRRLVKAAATRIFWLTGTRLTIRGLEHMPATPCIVVANHASYLDGPILTAVLPPHFGFVIKREMARIPLAHFLLQRIGSDFVERHDKHQRAIDARRLMQKARARESLAFFPEGTFVREPGLQRFHNGAFAAAVRGQMPVVPVVIRGSRQMLSADQFLPRPGRLEVVIQAPLLPSASDSVAALMQAVRRSILVDLEEPDRASTGVKLVAL